MKTPEQLAEEYIEILSYGRGQESYFSLQKLVHECQEELKARDKTIEELQQKFGCIY